MKTRILLVDDRHGTLDEAVKYFSDSADYVVVGIATGKQAAVRLFRKYEPDAIVLSVAEPECDGMSVLKTLGKTNCVIVAVGEDGSRDFAESVKRAGADYYEVKPLAPSKLDEKLKLLGSARPMTVPYKSPGQSTARYDKINAVIEELAKERAARAVDYSRWQYLLYMFPSDPKTCA